MRQLLILFIGLLPAALFAQTPAERKAAVERSLIPFVPVNGYPGWKLEDRMKAYGIPGVSIAVIRDGAIDWAQGYGWSWMYRSTTT